ncbi:MAG TPA: hypothetical protein VM219_02085 [Phycisphaerae bacterium]|nr:hypothetical protein [Phycisphaerae bacterium]
MNALTKGLAVLAIAMVVLAAARPAQAGQWQVRVSFSRPMATCAPSPLPWRTGHVPVLPVRQAYRAGYHDGYAHGFHDGVHAPVVVRRGIAPCGSAYSYRVIRSRSAWVRHGAVGGTVLTIRW